MTGRTRKLGEASGFLGVLRVLGRGVRLGFSRTRVHHRGNAPGVPDTWEKDNPLGQNRQGRAPLPGGNGRNRAAGKGNLPQVDGRREGAPPRIRGEPQKLGEPPGNPEEAAGWPRFEAPLR